MATKPKKLLAVAFAALLALTVPACAEEAVDEPVNEEVEEEE
jgi:outer membrane lipoprotein-sorting protein